DVPLARSRVHLERIFLPVLVSRGTLFRHQRLDHDIMKGGHYSLPFFLGAAFLAGAFLVALGFAALASVPSAASAAAFLGAALARLAGAFLALAGSAAAFGALGVNGATVSSTGASP